MRPVLFSGDALAAFLRHQRTATLPELKAVLGTSVDRTVFRKLASLHYRSSYSHRGRYYALDEVARFDSLGLWHCSPAWFSAHGSLTDTAAALVSESRAGYRSDELDDLLHVQTKDCLRHLTALGKLAREEHQGRPLYCSAAEGRRRAQLAARRAAQPTAMTTATLSVNDSLQAGLILFLSLLDERQRRLFAGLESIKSGTLGDSLVAQMMGLDPKTVTKGRLELLQRSVPGQRLRAPGAGRPPVEKKRRRSSRESKNS